MCFTKNEQNKFHTTKPRWLNKLSQQRRHTQRGLAHEWKHTPVTRRSPPSTFFHDPAGQLSRMSHCVVEHTMVALLPQTPAGYGNQGVEPLSLLLGNPFPRGAPPVRQARILIRGEVIQGGA
jgi:hypothetical protein